MLTSSDGDVPQSSTSAAPTSSSDSRSARRWHDAVREASSRTTHAVTPAAGPRDPRYRSDDPVVDGIWRALCDVADPELPVSLVDLGLICDVRRTDQTVEVDVTFTATACPCMEFIIDDIRERVLREPAVEQVIVRDVWDPPWTTERMTTHGKTLLKSFGVAA